MTPATATAYQGQDHRHMGWLSRSEAWLDSKGKGAWIAAMVLGFVFFWPVGLALLAYMIWSKQMFRKSCRRNSRSLQMRKSGMVAMKSSGNTAFDAYKSETLRRLEEEQEQFESFLERLREAKDKAEFDQFMDERARKTRDEAETRQDEDA
ncbi:hypothetical protein OB2597_02012 [Pseudooceanicola batsensis HTCC2597]|uniref:DUF2852 domain-containing protein n=1 Tax=Pseudooceanicola batsensis (strain ATCC BAA-863 / DSM 15984 / KCTC 12145 / HTCC2597) TaxID=252305 RepID=A3TWZ6_PSEBH|nr:DUF2852 domain-containing protein [Pseudooceanicola batsensis]EAQ03356.1 hypothetical protein OB2597_02012 [Pseudooceanicola batsensis HTCC2597]